jgi:hypothetical protein
MEAVFILLEFPSPSRRIFIGSHSPPSLVCRIGPSGPSFEVVDPLPEISLLSLACEWPPRTNGSFPYEWRSLSGFRVEDPSGARKGGPNRPSEWAGPADLGRPAQAHLGPVRSPLHSCGSSCIYALSPFHLHDFDDVILSSKMEVLRA